MLSIGFHFMIKFRFDWGDFLSKEIFHFLWQESLDRMMALNPSFWQSDNRFSSCHSTHSSIVSVCLGETISHTLVENSEKTPIRIRHFKKRSIGKKESCLEDSGRLFSVRSKKCQRKGQLMAKMYWKPIRSNPFSLALFWIFVSKKRVVVHIPVCIDCLCPARCAALRVP